MSLYSECLELKHLPSCWKLQYLFISQFRGGFSFLSSSLPSLMEYHPGTEQIGAQRLRGRLCRFLHAAAFPLVRNSVKWSFCGWVPFLMSQSETCLKVGSQGITRLPLFVSFLSGITTTACCSTSENSHCTHTFSVYGGKNGLVLVTPSWLE